MTALALLYGTEEPPPELRERYAHVEAQFYGANHANTFGGPSLVAALTGSETVPRGDRTRS